MGKNNDDELIDVDYKNWVNSISQRYKQSRIKAAVAVNKELVEFYWF